MRDIKFRGQMVKDKEWCYGWLLKDAENSTAYYDDYPYRIVWHREDGAHCNSPVITKTIGQYTGLHDKNGKEIYEGDVVKIAIEQYGYDGSSKDYRIIKGEIKWSHLGFDIKIGTHDGKPVYSDIIQEMHLTDNIISDEWEVIGNTYDDTEATP